MLNVELPNGLNGASLIQHSTFNIQHSKKHSTLTSVEYRSKGTFAIEKLLRLLLDTQLPYHIKVVIAALYTEPSVLHADEGNAGNQ